MRRQREGQQPQGLQLREQAASSEKPRSPEVNLRMTVRRAVVAEDLQRPDDLHACNRAAFSAIQPCNSWGPALWFASNNKWSRIGSRAGMVSPLTGRKQTVL